MDPLCERSDPTPTRANTESPGPARDPPFCLVRVMLRPLTLAHLGGASCLTALAPCPSSCAADEPTAKLMRGARGTPDASVRAVGARLIRVVARTDMAGDVYREVGRGRGWRVCRGTSCCC